MREPCDICNATVLSPYLEVSLCGVFDASVCACERCGFRQIRPRLSRAEIAALYPSEYFDSASEMGFADYARQQQRHQREARFLVRELRRLGATGRLLEVGCALGFLLEAVRRLSSWDVTGVDVSPVAAAFARRAYGLEVSFGTLEEACFPDAAFDFIVQKDVLEHVARPREQLAETRRILRVGGQVWLVTPNGEANLRPLRDIARRIESAGANALPLLDQGHLSFFGRDHLLRLADECGFECERMRSLGVMRGLRALGYLPRKKRSLKMAPRRGPRAGIDGKGESRPSLEEAVLARLCEQLTAEIEAARRPLRGWLPYVYFRRAMRFLDTLPGSIALGNDFELVLRKR